MTHASGFSNESVLGDDGGGVFGLPLKIDRIKGGSLGSGHRVDRTTVPVSQPHAPAVHFSELLGADLEIRPGHTLELPLQPHFEHAFLVLTGDAMLDGQPLEARRRLALTGKIVDGSETWQPTKALG
jgi:redox-sensitive bicupin YhaK (pirin superfamily)